MHIPVTIQVQQAHLAQALQQINFKLHVLEARYAVTEAVVQIAHKTPNRDAWDQTCTGMTHAEFRETLYNTVLMDALETLV